MKKLLVGEDLVKSFGSGAQSQRVLHAVCVEMAQGEFVAVMGPSGCGKSTLLYALSGMDRVDSGAIYFDQQDLAALSDDRLADVRREKMGFVFQQPTLLRNLNLLDNILLPQMRGRRRDVKRLTQQAMALMEQVGIADLAGRAITQVSGGQLQRAGICRALMNRPQILFADEPTGALHSKSTDEILDAFTAIHRTGTAILVVTHDVKVAARAQRVLFMRDGNIVSQLSHTGEAAGKAERILAETRRLGM